VIDRFSGEYRFLSNPYPTTITFEGVTYQSTEYAFQASKTLDKSSRLDIANAPTWQAAKQLGRRVTLRPYWDQYWRYAVMEQLLAIKFVANSELSRLLLKTKPLGLIEGNTWHDQIWGDCRCGKTVCQPNGMNLLGWMLVRQRSML
jgi:ribA/ribD-fused uncharacterized protein